MIAVGLVLFILGSLIRHIESDIADFIAGIMGFAGLGSMFAGIVVWLWRAMP